MSEQPSQGLTSYTKDTLFELTAKNPTNTYICIHENVYDVTQFQDEHPGGEEALKEHQIKDNKFKDATESFEDVGHSMDAREMMQKYQIGVLEGKKKTVAKLKAKDDTSTNNESKSSLLSLVIPLSILVVGVGVAYQYISHRAN